MSLAYVYTSDIKQTQPTTYIHVANIANIKCNIFVTKSLVSTYSIYFTFFHFTFFFSASAEASCAAVVRSAKGFVEDVGAAAAVKSRGMLELSRCSEKMLREIAIEC